MTERIRCFWVEPTGQVQQSLRRYCSRELACSLPSGYHDASVQIEPAPARKSDRGYVVGPEASEFADDPRWPARCACGYEFVATDVWQVHVEQLYRAADGREWSIRKLPPGAMYDAWWYHGHAKGVGPDGVALIVVLPPNGQDDWWHVDGSANNGPGWQRTGAIPDVTATPSILTSRYHGWLRDGWLVSC